MERLCSDETCSHYGRRLGGPDGWTCPGQPRLHQLHDLLRDPGTTIEIKAHQYGPITRFFAIAWHPQRVGLVHAALCMIREIPTAEVSR